MQIPATSVAPNSDLFLPLRKRLLSSVHASPPCAAFWKVPPGGTEVVMMFTSFVSFQGSQSCTDCWLMPENTVISYILSSFLGACGGNTCLLKCTQPWPCSVCDCLGHGICLPDAVSYWPACLSSRLIYQLQRGPSSLPIATSTSAIATRLYRFMLTVGVRFSIVSALSVFLSARISESIAVFCYENRGSDNFLSCSTVLY